MTQSVEASDDTRYLRVGVVGYGNRGIIAKRGVEADGHAAVVAIVDPLESAQQRAREHFGPEVTIAADVADLATLDLDAVFVTSLDNQHADHASPLLEAGIPVFVDKPLAISIEAADAILETFQPEWIQISGGYALAA